MHNHSFTPPRPPLSRHARVQMQRRSIPEAAVELLLDFADCTPSWDGTRRYRFTKRSWAAAAAFLGPDVRLFEKFRNAYVVEASDGTIITAAWLH